MAFGRTLLGPYSVGPLMGVMMIVGHGYEPSALQVLLGL
jgi:hypothetical protein